MNHITLKHQEISPICLQKQCIITVCDCRKGSWHQQLDETSSFWTTLNTKLGRFCYTVMPFGATVASNVFQHKLDESFGKIEQVIIIADDIMIVGTSQITVIMTKHSQPCCI